MKKWIKTFINSVHWTVVDTKSGIAQECTVLYWNMSNKQLFIDFARMIRNCGYEEECEGRVYKHFKVGSYKYWTTDPEPEKANQINRAKI